MKELDYGKLGARIRQVRKVKGWSQDDLAKRCGVSMSFLGHIERGTRVMSIETFVNICEALDAGADELLWGVIHTPNAVQKMCESESQQEKDKMDSYSMYVRIMKSVAEIMSEA